MSLQLNVRRVLTIIDHKTEEAGRIDPVPLRRLAVVMIVNNPCAGRYVEDLKPMVDASVPLGHEMAKLALEAFGPYKVQSYGKAGVVGLGGEQEHAAALLTSAFAEPLRKALGGGKAWITSYTKVAAPNATIDVPLAHKDALYVRSHYDGMTVTIPDGPQADEVALIFAIANRGRLNARVGGLHVDDVKGQDGLY
jgi:hypothetical protein